MHNYTRTNNLGIIEYQQRALWKLLSKVTEVTLRDFSIAIDKEF
jgi:hypothetical protein